MRLPITVRAAVVGDDVALVEDVAQALRRVGIGPVDVLGCADPVPDRAVELVLLAATPVAVVGRVARARPVAALVYVDDRQGRDVPAALRAGADAVVDLGATEEQLLDLVVGARWAHRTLRSGAA